MVVSPESATWLTARPFYEEILTLFFRFSFSLPGGYTKAIFFYMLGTNEFRAQQIINRLRFFKRCTWKSGSMRSVMLEDRRLYLLKQVWWNAKFEVLFESLFPPRSFCELDLFDDDRELQLLLKRESASIRDIRLLSMPSGILFREFFLYQAMPCFLAELSSRSFEEVRLLLIFFANMFRFCFFTRTTDFCPLCTSHFSSSHFLDCPFVESQVYFQLQEPDWRDLCLSYQWQDFLDLFFVVGHFWSSQVNAIRQGHSI